MVTESADQGRRRCHSEGARCGRLRKSRVYPGCHRICKAELPGWHTVFCSELRHVRRQYDVGRLRLRQAPGDVAREARSIGGSEENLRRLKDDVAVSIERS